MYTRTHLLTPTLVYCRREMVTFALQPEQKAHTGYLTFATKPHHSVRVRAQPQPIAAADAEDKE
eukprot:m.47065 g.47065  ORF g.47065 m.47065 type:complete len:64 (+) comp10955_c0_seq2:1069-1260(+)